jgi:hypothetical protein
MVRDSSGGQPTGLSCAAYSRQAGELRRAGWAFTLSGMRDFDTIDSELSLLAAVRRSIREHGVEPSSRQVDELLDERAELTGS